MLDEKAIRSDLNNIRNIVSLMEEAFDNLNELLKKKKTLEKEINDAHEAYCNSIIEEVKRESGSNSLINYKDMKLSYNINHYDQPTIKLLYQYSHFISIYEHALKVSEATDKNMEYALDAVKPVISNLLVYMLSSKEDKALAVKACNLLVNYYNDGYVKQVETYYDKINNISDKYADDDFKDHEQEYVELLNFITKSENYIEEDVEQPDFVMLKEAEEKILEANNSMNRCLKYKNFVLKDVSSKAYNIVKDKGEEILREISIDELNQDHKGLKIAPLRNAGLITVMDVLKKSEWDLSSLNGISDTAASNILKIANEFKDNAFKSVKIRLNEDTKDKLSTELLMSIFAFIQNKTVFKKIDNLDEECGSIARTLYPISNEHNDEIKWLTASSKEKQLISKAIPVYEKVIKEDLLNKADTIYNELMAIDSSADEEKAWDYFRNNTSFVYTQLEETVPGLFSNGDTYYGLPEDLAKEVNEEQTYLSGLHVTLRRYQEWGVKYILHQKKVLLGDEMGLGKTVQAIAAMVSLRNTGKKWFVVVAPASVLVNWCREIEKHSNLKAYKIHGDNREGAFEDWKAHGGVAVTTYETTGHLEFEDDFVYAMLTVDEAHYCKNPNAQRTKNVVELGKHAERILYMTGTALENRVDEMIELVGQLNPELATEIGGVKYLSTADRFREKLATVYYRRKRLDVLTELPDLVINKEWCTLNEEEKTVYEQNVFMKNQADIRRVSWNAPDLSKSSKLNRMKEIVEEAKEEGRKVIFFSFFLDTVQKVQEQFKEQAYGPITGSIAPAKRQEIIDEFNKAEPGSVLIAQIIAGGTGLNIQAASVVILAEPQFKPSIENQAISRAYRMGQSRSVLVYRLLCENTADEKIMKVLEDKQLIFDTFANDSIAADANREIDETSFGDIIEEEIERIKRERK